MKILVKPLTEKEFEIEVNPECDVEHLKQLIERRCNVRVPQQRLVHLGKTLSEGSTLTKCKLVEGSKIHLFVKKPEGGAGPVSGVDRILADILRPYLGKQEVERVIAEFHKELAASFLSYSLDDLERLAINLLSSDPVSAK